MRNRQWLLKSRPVGSVSVENFEFSDLEIPEPELTTGQVLIRNLAFLLAPTVRNFMNESGRSYRASVPLGSPVIGPSAAEVVKSENPLWPVGKRLTALSSWQDYAVLDPVNSRTPVIAVPGDSSLVDAIGVYGMNSLTAYLGLMKIGLPERGETVVVSGAAGSVGSMVVQIAKIKGCRVIGIAGGHEKCRWVTESCHADAAIDYKSDDVRQRLADLCPKGVDIFFDNVGGEILQAVMDNIAMKGRVLVCGQISAYDGDTPAMGPRDMMRVVYWSVRIQGFVLGDFINDYDAARAELMRWNKEGKIVHREDVRQGFGALPAAFQDLFRGGNLGTAMVQNDSSASA